MADQVSLSSVEDIFEKLFFGYHLNFIITFALPVFLTLFNVGLDIPQCENSEALTHCPHEEIGESFANLAEYPAYVLENNNPIDTEC